MERADHAVMMENNVMNAESKAWINSLNKDNKVSILERMERCNINLVQVNVRGNMVALLQTGLEKLLHLGQKYLSTISLKKSMKINEFHFF
ncbi:unnamed protein product [Staurois parvus]|uniref:Uncharacterized protein n=1 Tax=Staurois parvus TaxID=386267 RepID=A0ABN9A8J3_9NEOB|nr:unnamed protein product [Staurois parvus]